jgi:hypothetical protein
MRKDIVIIALFLFAGLAVVGAEIKPKYAPTEIQTLRLQLRQKDAQIAQKDYFIAQQNFQAAVKALDDEADKVKTENQWPSGVLFDKDKLTFAEPPPEQPHSTLEGHYPADDRTINPLPNTVPQPARGRQ